MVSDTTRRINLDLDSQNVTGIDDIVKDIVKLLDDNRKTEAVEHLTKLLVEQRTQA